MSNKILFYNGASVTFADMDDHPCISLMALSAFLKPLGYESDVLKDRHTEAELREKLQGCLAVGFSVYTGNGILRSLHMASRIRQINKDIPLVWGGYHPTLEPDQVLHSESVDYVIRGEGEYPLAELLDCLRRGVLDGVDKIAGLSFKRDGQLCHNPPRPHSDLNDFPMTDYLLYDDYLKRHKTIPFISTRGCPFDCRFCCSSAFNHLLGKRFRQLSVENIIRDVDFLVKRYAPEVIEFIDDNFLSNRELIVRFVEAYRQRGYSFRWCARARCDFFLRLDDEIVKSLHDIGLIKIDFGVESGSQRILDLVRKRSDVGKVLQAVKRSASFGLWNYCTFMNGIPGETLEEVRMSVDLRNEIMKASPNSQVEFFVFTPLPGTELLEDCQKLGFSLPERLEDYAGYHFHHFQAPWLSAKHQRVATAISWASFFDIFRGDLCKWYIRIPSRILKYVARWRFKHNAFGFAPEFLIANAFYAAKALKHEKAYAKP